MRLNTIAYRIDPWDGDLPHATDHGPVHPAQAKWRRAPGISLKSLLGNDFRNYNCSNLKDPLVGTRGQAGASVPLSRNPSHKSEVSRQSFATQKSLGIQRMRPR